VNTVAALFDALSMNTSRPRILAIEADPDRRLQLEQFLRARVDADVAVADSASAAVRAMRFRQPDLVLASMLLPPSDDAEVMSHLNAIDDASRPAVLVVPPLQQAERPSTAQRLLHRLGLRRLAPFPFYDVDAIGSRIQEALEETMSDRSEALQSVRREDDHARRSAAAVRRLGPAPAFEPPATDVPIVLPNKGMIARAHRWNPAELPWVCSVKAPVGLDARVVNISRSGILIETGSKLVPGSIASVHLSGMGTALVVPARVVRSEVAAVEVAGVKYRIAASFSGRLDLVPEDSARPNTISRSAPQTLAELLARVSAEVDRGLRNEDVKAIFEQGVQQLAPACEVRLLETPAPTTERESIYFRVPGPSGSRAVLQVIFEPGCQPETDDFVLLKAAAAAATVVMTGRDDRPARHRAGEPRNLW
jgi:CheY-like chemotaxis protein